jgi:uncharacterized membrane protein
MDSNERFRHNNINLLHDERLTLGQHVADSVASIMGSWGFIITQSLLLILWITVNTVAFVAHWDSYPYILLNLALSFQAAFATPVILMSQNRTAEKDRLKADEDYRVNVKSEHEVMQILENIQGIVMLIEDQDKRELLLLEKFNMMMVSHQEQHRKIDLLLERTGKEPL